MTRITDNDFTLIGLHKMAAERGDGLIPEMLDVLRRSSEGLDEAGAELLQLPARRPDMPVATFRPASNENNVIPFPIARRRMTHR